MALTSTPGPRASRASRAFHGSHVSRTPRVPRASRDSSASRAPRASREADGLAVASFVLGLLGLLVMNILLGPAAIVMACLALARSTARRGRALLGLALGVADLVVLAVLVTVNGTVSWSFGG
ncbi:MULTISPECIES: hypothetical protein [Streptomyces]|uniref:hypothetical protein n=1 Tax=Streptomyces TaxID=1883 RepID=UPI00081B58A0|nr:MULTISPECIES: hypothetical protein [unclassified Streptomyces]MYQ51380.1 DUF4190 domain-containing protein [Streptomyces sp. SID4941]SCD59750.1 hypothetical protein GA0115247_108511 [Streptomyces sp. PalvLS-984]SDD41767.1 hypothetical protein F558DRAFT_04045 [Streptomyces sp. AmelKG-A3]